MWRIIIMSIFLLISSNLAVANVPPRGYIHPGQVPAKAYNRNQLNNGLNRAIANPKVDRQDPAIPPKDDLWGPDFFN